MLETMAQPRTRDDYEENVGIHRQLEMKLNLFAPILRSIFVCPGVEILEEILPVLVLRRLMKKTMTKIMMQWSLMMVLLTNLRELNADANV